MSVIFGDLYKARNTITGEIKLFDSQVAIKKFIESKFNKDWRIREQ